MSDTEREYVVVRSFIKFEPGDYVVHPVIGGWKVARGWRPGYDAQVEAEALREAADEMETVIADGDVAEVAAPVPGEVGRGAVVARRDALYEEPHTWLHNRADQIEQGGKA